MSDSYEAKGSKMNNELEKNLALISGKTPDEIAANQLSDIDRAQMSNALDTLFSGLTLSNWLNGGGLGDAWNISLDQLRKMIYEITDVNPAVVCLRQLAAEHRIKWQKTIASGVNFNEHLNCSAGGRKEYAAHAQGQIDEGMSVLRQKISEFDSDAPGKANSPRAKNVEIANALANERSGNERVKDRERTRS
jgi:hypothetical protein